MRRSRPIEFVAIVLTLWVGGRAFVLLRDRSLRPVYPDESRRDPALQSLVKGVSRSPSPVRMSASATVSAHAVTLAGVRPLPRIPDKPQHLALLSRLPDTKATATANATSDASPPAAAAIPGAFPAATRHPLRLRGSAYLLLQSGRALVDAPRLGGSQAGLRLFLDLSPHLFATNRTSSAGHGREAETTLGIGVRSGGIGVIVERRFRLSRDGRNAFAATVFGGVYSVVLPLGWIGRADAQAGVVGVRRRDGFAEGVVQVEHRLPRLPLAAGVGLWAGAQRGVSRVEAGPQLVLPLALGPTNARLAASYRLRLAGDAQPKSGFALTLGADF